MTLYEPPSPTGNPHPPKPGPISCDVPTVEPVETTDPVEPEEDEEGD